MSSGERISPSEVINNAAERALKNAYTWAPAKVVKIYDTPVGQKVDCQILIKRVDQDEEGEDVVSSWPVVPGVAVQFIGAGGFRLTCPIKAGPDGQETIGTLFFSHMSLDKWLTGSGGEVDPEHAHDHALADAMFMPGLMPFGAPWQSVSSDDMTIGDDADGNGRIHFKSAEIDLGEGATKGVARNGDKLTASAAMGTWAGLVEGVCNGIAPGTFVPATSFAGATPANPGGSKNFGTVAEGSNHIKAVD